MAEAGASRLPAGAELVHDADTVARALQRMAGELQPFVEQGDCVLLAVMLGGMLPAASLAARLEGDFVLDYCHVTRYRGGLEPGLPEWRQPPEAALAGRTVVIVDDIFDEGVTLDYVRRACAALGAARILSAVLVEKEHGRPRSGSHRPDIVGLSVPDRYVFGCGMDLRDHWRHLDAIYAVPASGGEGAA